MNFERYSTHDPLRRLGKKNVIAKELSKYTPENFNTIISLFYGTGSFENNYIGKIDYIFANDYDANVINLYNVLKTKPNELIEEIELLPIHSDVFAQNKDYKTKQISDVEKAMFFLLYSNFGYMGRPDALRYVLGNSKKNLLKNIKGFLKEIVNNEKTTVSFTNYSYEKVLSKISFMDNDKKKCFLFCDPPYLDTANNYDTPVFSEKDHANLQKVCIESEIQFMICEFDHPEVLKLAAENNLFITEVGERQNMKNRRTEIILTNYPTNYYKQKTLF